MMMFIKTRQSGLGETSQHVLKNTAILEVLNLHVSVKSHLHVEGLASIGGHCKLLVHLEATLADVNVELLFSSQTLIGRIVPRLSALCPGRNSRGRMPIPAKLLRWILSKD